MAYSRYHLENFFRLVWRWHFWVGMLVAPILLLTAVTGAIYIFKDEIETTADSSLKTCQAQGERQPFDSLIVATQQKYPESTLLRATVYGEAERTTSIQVKTATGTLVVFVNPYTAVVQGDMPLQANNFFNVVLKLHRRVYAGSTGRAVVELVTSWAIVLTISGIYLWWPRRWTQVKGVWWPRVFAHRYTVLRDLHTIPGVFMSLFIIIIAGTGLFFTQYWGQLYTAAVGPQGAFPRDFTSPPKLDPIPTQRVAVQNAIDAAEARWPGETLMVELGTKKSDPIGVLARRTGGDFLLGYIALDPASGEIIKETRAETQSLLAKIRLWVYPLHVGSIYGTPTKILALFTCLVLVFASISGVWMWWERKPKGKTGFPRAGRIERVPIAAAISILVLAFVLPTVLVTLVAAVAGEGIWRITRSRRYSAIPEPHHKTPDQPPSA